MNNKMELELRNYGNIKLSSDNQNTVYGKAIPFEVQSRDLGFIETIHKGSITQELIDNSDVYARINHKDDYILARSNKGKGSLKLELKEDGVYYSFEIPDTEKGRELREHIKREEIFSSSFYFSVSTDEGSERWSKRSDGKIYRDVYKVGFLGDIAPVFSAAYPTTTCSLRGQNIQATSAEIDHKMNLLLDEIEKL